MQVKKVIEGIDLKKVIENVYKDALSRVFTDCCQGVRSFNDNKSACRAVSNWGNASKDNYRILQEWIMENFGGENILNKSHNVWANPPVALQPWGVSLLFSQYVDFCCAGEKNHALVNAAQKLKVEALKELEYLKNNMSEKQKEIAFGLYNFFKKYLSIQLMKDFVSQQDKYIGLYQWLEEREQELAYFLFAGVFENGLSRENAQLTSAEEAHQTLSPEDAQQRFMEYMAALFEGLLAPQEVYKMLRSCDLPVIFKDDQESIIYPRRLLSIRRVCREVSCLGSTSKGYYAAFQKWIVKTFPEENIANGTHNVWANPPIRPLPWNLSLLFQWYMQWSCDIYGNSMLSFINENDEHAIAGRMVTVNRMKEVVHDFKNENLEKLCFTNTIEDVERVFQLVSFFRDNLNVKILYNILRDDIWIIRGIKAALLAAIPLFVSGALRLS